MGFQYTKKKEDDEQQERTVQAEDFAKNKAVEMMIEQFSNIETYRKN